MKIAIKLPMAEVARMTKTPLSTLYRWQKHKPYLYKLVCRGCVETKMDEKRFDLP